MRLRGWHHQEPREPGAILAFGLALGDLGIDTDTLVDAATPPHTTLLALLDGEIAVDSFTDDRLRAPDVAALLPRTQLTFDDSIPFDKVKIDRSFIDDLTSSANARAIVGAILALVAVILLGSLLGSF